MSNTDKLTLHNLCVPMHKRISVTELRAKVAFARTRGNVIALWIQMRAPVEARAQAYAAAVADNARPQDLEK